jgi:hypothetical protein
MPQRHWMPRQMKGTLSSSRSSSSTSGTLRAGGIAIGSPPTASSTRLLRPKKEPGTSSFTRIKKEPGVTQNRTLVEGAFSRKLEGMKPSNRACKPEKRFFEEQNLMEANCLRAKAKNCLPYILARKVRLRRDLPNKLTQITTTSCFRGPNI